jgi:hypothetical protein
MYRKPSKKQLLIQRSIVLAIMAISVIVIVIGTILFILGYRLDGSNGRLEQGALIQFDSRPNGATFSIDGVPTGAQTASKRSVIAGQHTITMNRAGYHPWERTRTFEAGTLTWLDYVRLVPTDLTRQTVRSYESVAGVKTAPDLQTIVVQPAADQASFEVIDIRSQQIRPRTVAIPADLLSDLSAEDVTHRYEMDTWDSDGRYLLVRHFYRDTNEWIVFDTENPAESENVTRLLSINLTDLQFASTNGNVLYGLTDGVVRKLDLDNATISRGLVSNVSKYVVYGTSLFTYVGRDAATPQRQVAGFYRDGDREPHVVRTVDDLTMPLNIATARYASDDYLVIAEGLEVTVLKGRYPSTSQSLSETMRPVETFTATATINQLEFSPRGDYVLVRSGLAFTSYEVEYDLLHESTVETSVTRARALRWLDDAHLLTSYEDRLTMRDFDGTNIHTLMPVVAGFDVTLSQNGRYLYAVTKTDDTYRLERATMILE